MSTDAAGQIEWTQVKNARYLKQAIVVRKDLSMPQGKLAAMVAHAAMTFIVKRFDAPRPLYSRGGSPLSVVQGTFTNNEVQWMTEHEPGLESIGQHSFAKIVLAVDSFEELFVVEDKAYAHGLHVERVVDGGYSHNKFGDVPAIAIGPAWPEELEPVTGKLKLYR